MCSLRFVTAMSFVMTLKRSGIARASLSLRLGGLMPGF